VRNVASLRMSLREGSKLTHYVSYLRVLWYERLRVTSELPAKLRGAADMKRGAGPGGRATSI
jgi:hypothetical protein